MLVPTNTMHTKYFKELFVDDRIQVIPHKKRQFTSNKKDLKKSGCAFYTSYVCYKGMGLLKDVVLL